MAWIRRNPTQEQEFEKRLRKLRKEVRQVTGEMRETARRLLERAEQLDAKKAQAPETSSEAYSEENRGKSLVSVEEPARE